MRGWRHKHSPGTWMPADRLFNTHTITINRHINGIKSVKAQNIFKNGPARRLQKKFITWLKKQTHCKRKSLQNARGHHNIVETAERMSTVLLTDPGNHSPKVLIARRR